VKVGVKVKINLLEEQVFGPLVLFGLAGASVGALADRAARLAPLTESDADDLIRSVRAAAPLLLGRSGVSASDLASLRACCCGFPSWPTISRRSPSWS
jgi:ATP-grasp domain-containing protein